MTATPTRTPTRQVYRPVRHITVPAAQPVEAVVLPTGARSASGLLLGLFGVVLAFAALPLAFSQPVLAVFLLLVGALLLLALMARQASAATDEAEAPMSALDHNDPWF